MNPSKPGEGEQIIDSSREGVKALVKEELSNDEILEKGYAKENLYYAQVPMWEYKNGLFTGRTEKHYPQGCGWSFRTNLAPGRDGNIPFLKELVDQVQSEDDLHALEENGFVQVKELPGMQAVTANEVPFIEARLEE